MQGKITNVVDFGAFVNCGLISGLIHISQLAEHHVDDPHTIVQEGQTVFVKIIGLDLAKKRLSLSLKQAVRQITRTANSKQNLIAQTEETRNETQSKTPLIPATASEIKLAAITSFSISCSISVKKKHTKAMIK